MILWSSFIVNYNTAWYKCNRVWNYWFPNLFPNENTQILWWGKPFWKKPLCFLWPTGIPVTLLFFRAHYPATFSSEDALKTGKKLWASEDYSTFNDKLRTLWYNRSLDQNNSFWMECLWWNACGKNTKFNPPSLKKKTNKLYIS